MSRRSWLLAAVCAVLVLLPTGCGSGYDNDDVRNYIADHYTRATRLDEKNNGMAYTAGKRVSAVADEITGTVHPLDRRTSGKRTFLQYRHDIIAITPHAGGAKILVDDYRTGHRRHQHYIGIFGWPSGNTGFRGGGPGDGK